MKFCSCEILFVSRCKEYYIVEAKIGRVKLRRIRLKAVNTWARRGEIGKNGVDEFPEKRKKREYVCVCVSVWRHLSPRVRVFQRYVPYIEPCTRTFSVIYIHPWVYLDSDVWEVSLDRKVPWNEARKLEAAWIFEGRHENFEIVKMQEFHRPLARKKRGTER